MKVICNWMDDKFGECVVISPCCGGFYSIKNAPDRNPISFLCKLTADGIAFGIWGTPDEKGNSTPIWIPMRVCPCCGSPFEIANQGLEEIITAKED